MLKEAHTISYIQQASREWIEGDEEEIAYTQATESLRVVPPDIQHRLKVLHRFKVAHEPLVKTLSSFENMESHGEPIKLVFRQLITWTSPKEGITLLKFFGGIGIGLEAILQSGLVVWRYFYVDIDPITRQVATSSSQLDFHNILRPPHGRPASLCCLLTSNYFRKNIWNYLASWTSSFQVGSVKDF
jgi:hypothetical protein